MTKAKPPKREWDAEAIKAEIRRRGLNMTKIAIDAGLTEAACRKALFGLSRPGADAIAAALGIPFDDSMGIAIDTLTEEQSKYLSSWEMGT